MQIMVELKILLGALPDTDSDIIQQAFRGLGTLPFYKEFAEGSFSAF